MILSILSTAWRFRSAIGIAIAAIAALSAFAYVRHLHNRIDTLTVRAEQYAEAAKNNAAAIDMIQANALAEQAALNEAHKTEIARLKRRAELQKDLSHAPVTMSCIDSPAMRILLERLRERPTRSGG